jgi:hypothetical protein
MAMKFRIKNLDRARECIQWLISNIGEIESNQGIIIRGVGWTANLVITPEEFMVVDIELNQHVDERDATIVMLRWS